MTATLPLRDTSDTTSPATRRLLWCGVAAAPLFLVVVATQVATRDGFDLTRHPVSSLALGTAGWVQVAAFVVTGALVIAAAVGLRRSLPASRGGTWGPRLLAVYGVGLVVAGVFVTDPADGFPLGASAPASPSWHAILHGVGALGIDAFVIAALLLARRFHHDRDRAWTVAAVVVGLGTLALLVDPTAPLMTVRMAVSSVITLGSITALCWRELRS